MSNIIGKILQVIGAIVVILIFGITLGIVLTKPFSPSVDRTPTDTHMDEQSGLERSASSGLSNSDSGTEPSDPEGEDEEYDWEVELAIAYIRSNFTLFNIFWSELYEDWIDHPSYYNDPYEWIARFVHSYNTIVDHLVPSVESGDEKIASNPQIPSRYVSAHSVYAEVVKQIHEALTFMNDALLDGNIDVFEEGFDELLIVLSVSKVALDATSETFLD